MTIPGDCLTPIEVMFAPGAAALLARAGLLKDAIPEIRRAIFIRQGVCRADVAEIMRAYDSVLLELEEHLGVIVSLDPADRPSLPTIDFGEAERLRKAVAHQKTGFATPDPVLLAEASARVAGVHPPVLTPHPGESIAVAKLRFSVESVAYLLRHSAADTTN